MECILRAKRNELTSKLMLSGTDGLTNDLRKMDPETQARLEALLEAAGTTYRIYSAPAHGIGLPHWGLPYEKMLIRNFCFDP